MAVTSDFLDPLKKFAKPKTFRTTSILFLFFYRATVAIHVLFCLMVAGKAYFGDPIDCQIRKTDIKLLNQAGSERKIAKM